LREAALGVLAGVPARLSRALRAVKVIRAEAGLARAAVDERVREPGDVAARLPDARVHQDRGVEPLDVVTLVNHRAPPRFLHVALQLDAERAVVPDRARAAVDLGRLEDETTSLAERHQPVHPFGTVRHFQQNAEESAAIARPAQTRGATEGEQPPRVSAGWGAPARSDTRMRERPHPPGARPLTRTHDAWTLRLSAAARPACVPPPPQP